MEILTKGEPGRGKICSHCSFQNFHFLTKGNQLSLVRMRFFSNPESPKGPYHTQNAMTTEKVVKHYGNSFLLLVVFCYAGSSDSLWHGSKILCFLGPEMAKNYVGHSDSLCQFDLLTWQFWGPFLELDFRLAAKQAKTFLNLLSWQGVLEGVSCLGHQPGLIGKLR